VAFQTNDPDDEFCFGWNDEFWFGRDRSNELDLFEITYAGTEYA